VGTLFDGTFVQKVLNERQGERVQRSACTWYFQTWETALGWEGESQLYGFTHPSAVVLPGILEVAQPTAYW
jgi:hypothetical protein